MKPEIDNLPRLISSEGESLPAGGLFSIDGIFNHHFPESLRTGFLNHKGQMDEVFVNKDYLNFKIKWGQVKKIKEAVSKVG